jgi:uncharacterized protein (TIGR02391 family)
MKGLWMPGRDFVLTDEQVRALPVDLLALEVLKDALANDEWNSRNWLLGAQQGGEYSAEAIRALNETWEWLHNHGLVAMDRTNNSHTAIVVTRLGQEFADGGNVARLRANARLAVDLHPILEPLVRPQFLMGEYEMAAFAGMKAVEVRVRTMSGLDDSMIGVRLMQTAFGTGGPLEDQSIESGEREARRNLFAGAIGTIKNPTSHREVRYDDPTEASEAVLLADLLMRILDRVASAS